MDVLGAAVTAAAEALAAEPAPPASEYDDAMLVDDGEPDGVKLEDEPEAEPLPPPLRDKPTAEELAALVKQRQLFHAQSETMLQLAKRHKEVTGVDPLSTALKDVNGRLPVEDAKRARLALSPHAEAVLMAQFAVRDVLSRDDFAAAAKLARCSEEAARATFQSMRARARRFITKHAPPPTAVAAPAAASALAATPFDDDDDDAPAPAPDATLAALAAAVAAPPLAPVPRPPTPAERDEPLIAELAALRQPDGSVAFPAAAAAAVALMRRAVSVGLRASLADLVHDSRMQLGVPIVFMDEGACVPLAAWMDAALNTHHVTLLRKAMRAAAALPVASAEPVKELARQLHRCRTYVRADDVATEATRILAAWAKVVTPNGGGGSRAAPAIPAMPRMQLPPLPPAPFNGPAISKAATAQLAARAAAPATVAVRSAADRLAGANERVATGARPLSADEILRQRNKKRLMIGSSSGAAPARGGSAAPLPPELAKRLKMVAGSTAPPVNVAAPPPPDEDAMQARVEFAHPPTVAVEGLGVLGVCGTGWGCESVEAALQARRESETPAAEYMLAALIPDDPAAPLHVSTEAHAALAAPTPLLPDVPVDFADAAQQAGVLARAGYIAAAQHMGAGWRPHR